MPDTLEAERLHIDGFPVEVYAPELLAHPLVGRVFITNRRIIAYVETPADGHRLLVSKFLDHPITGGELPTRNRGSFFGQVTLQTEDGPVHVTKAGGCGCGSPLRALALPVDW